MKYKNEEQILNIVKYIPPLFIVFLSLIAWAFIYYEYQKSFIKEKELIEKNYIQANKEIIQNQVNTVHNFIIKEQESTEKKLRDNIKKRVYEAHKIATNIYKENKDKDKKTVEKLIKDALRTIRFNDGRGYYFINTFKGMNVMHAVLPFYEDKNLWNFRDVNGQYVVQETVKKLQEKDETFHEWYWRKSEKDFREYKKIGFLKKFEPLNWYIGTAEYFDDFEKTIQKNVLEQINNFKYEKNGYIFIFNFKGIYLAHATKRNLGKNIHSNNGIIDQYGNIVVKQVFTQFVDLAKRQEGGFISYIQARKPSTNLPASKITYIQGIPGWNWLIGKGFYEDDVNKKLNQKKKVLDRDFKKYMNQLLIFTLVMCLFLLIVSLFFSKAIESKFKDYKLEIKNYLEENTKQQNILAQQSKMAAMGEMIGNIAHQWRQPLSMISTAATGMKLNKELGNLKDEDMLTTLDAINTSVQHLSHTIDDFRDFFKPNKQKTKFSLDAIINRTINLVSSQFISKEIKLIKKVKDIELIGYERELLQVLINLLNNAKDALDNTSHEKLIFIRSYEENDVVIIEVKDNAGGIPANIIQKIFEPYFTTKHKSQGTGVGLYMSKEIIEKHMSGSIEVNNEAYNHKKGHYMGATFKICLPLTMKG